MTDTSLIEAVARDLCDHMTVGKDPFGVALADTMYVENMAKDAADAKRIVDEMCRIAAARMVSRVRRWEAENGWRCVPKEWSPEMWKVWEECEGGGEMEFQAVVSSSPPPPGSAEGVKE